MDLLPILNDYFRGEKQVGIALAVFGLLLVAFAAWTWRTQTGSFAPWLAVPLAVAGLAFGGGGTVLAWRTESQVADLTARFHADPQAMAAHELPRMVKVNANWPRVKLAWTVLAVTALLLLMAVRKDWSEGLGLALLAITTPLFFVDVFAARRAVPYTAALQVLGDAAKPGAQGP